MVGGTATGPRFSPGRPILVGAAFVALFAGFLLNDRCAGAVLAEPPARSRCYSDLMAVFDEGPLREGEFPYVEAEFVYPALTGLYAGAASEATERLSPAQPTRTFFRLNATGLAAAGIAVVLMLAGLASDRRRVLSFALAPALVFYAFHNWDLLAVALATAGLYAYWRNRDGWAGAAIGLGAAAKLYPGILLLGLVLGRWRERGRAPLRLMTAATLGFAIVNIPVFVASPGGWLFPWRFQATRWPNIETHWYFLARHAGAPDSYARLTGILSAVLFIVAAAALLSAEMRRPRPRVYALGFGLVAVFLLTGKVFSPQFALWALPFFAILGFPWYAYGLFVVTDLAVLASVNAALVSIQQGVGDLDFRLALTEAATYARYGVLVWLLWLSRRVPELVRSAAPVQS